MSSVMVPAAPAEAVASSRGSRRHGRLDGDSYGVQRPASAAAKHAYLNLLGGFGLIEEGQPVEPPTSARRVLAFLALQGPSVHRLCVAGNLWPDVSEPNSSASLRTALWRLRRCGCDIVESRGDHLALRDHVGIDIRELEVRARELLNTPQAPAGEVVATLCLAGDLLPDWYEDWLLIERESLRQLRLHALEALCERLTGSGRLGEALQAALAAVSADPLRESAHRALIRVYLAEGNRSEVFRQYALFRDLLHERLEIEPSSQIRELVAFRSAR
jgi:DNA-binding SARP family transcriptional activator